MNSPDAAIEAALGYARNGWAVLPIWWLDAAGRCACGKPSDSKNHKPGKHPIGSVAPHGVKDATTDEATIRRWFTRYPIMNIGIACGGVSGDIVGIDVDPKNGGDETLAALEERYGPLPKTVTNLTGGGGVHYLFHADAVVRASLRGTLGPGIDIKSDGGYLVVPPSRHVSGGEYTWDAAAHPDDTPIAELPAWVVEASRAKGMASTSNANGTAALANHNWQASVIGTLINKGVPAEVVATIVAKAVAELAPHHGGGQPYTEDEARKLAEELYRRYSTSTAAPDEANRRRLRVVRLSDVTPEHPQWIWPGRIVMGALNIIEADPDVGKTTVALDIAARITRGTAMPDGPPGDLDGPRAVIYLTAEDSLSTTIRPRLDAAGADIDLVHAVTGVTIGDDPEQPLELPTDIRLLEELIRDTSAVMLVTDVLVAFLADYVDTHSDHKVRRVLSQLYRMAERTGSATLAIRHLNKSGGGNAIYRGGGSIGIAGQARSVLVLAPDPEDESGARRVLAVTKNNLAPPRWKGSITFSLEETPSGSPRVAWGAASELSARALLATSNGADERTAQDDLTELLQHVLADGPVAANEVIAAGRRSGYGDKAIRKAAKDFGVAQHREGFGPGSMSYWSLPPAILGILSPSSEEGKYAKYEESTVTGDVADDPPLADEVYLDLPPPADWPCHCGSASTGLTCWNCGTPRPDTRGESPG